MLVTLNSSKKICAFWTWKGKEGQSKCWGWKTIQFHANWPRESTYPSQWEAEIKIDCWREQSWEASKIGWHCESASRGELKAENRNQVSERVENGYKTIKPWGFKDERKSTDEQGQSARQYASALRAGKPRSEEPPGRYEKEVLSDGSDAGSSEGDWPGKPWASVEEDADSEDKLDRGASVAGQEGGVRQHKRVAAGAKG